MKYTSNRTSVEEGIAAQILAELTQEAVEYERIVDGMMAAPKTGRFYKASKRGPDHRASAPGEAPGIWTAMLRKGIRHVVTRLTNLNYSVQVGVTVESGRGGPVSKDDRSIAEMLEFGTTGMEPRPMWRPALVLLREQSATAEGAKAAETP